MIGFENAPHGISVTSEGSDDDFDPESNPIHGIDFLVDTECSHVLCLAEAEAMIMDKMIPDPKLAEHISSFQFGDFVPKEMLNYNLPWRKTREFPQPELKNFVPYTSPDRFSFDT